MFELKWNYSAINNIGNLLIVNIFYLASLLIRYKKVLKTEYVANCKALNNRKTCVAE